jgi:hypothetical protein
MGVGGHLLIFHEPFQRQVSQILYHLLYHLRPASLPPRRLNATMQILRDAAVQESAGFRSANRRHHRLSGEPAQTPNPESEKLLQ